MEEQPILEQPKHVLVTDYDQCAISYTGTDPEMVSIPFLAFAMKTPYIGFYGCTHRSHRNNSFVIRNASKLLNGDVYDRKNLSDQVNTKTLTAVLERRLGLQCLTVSTFDDTVKGKKCGDGFNYGSKENGASFVRFLFNLRTKNRQLVQIANHVSDEYPKGTVFTLDYVDDNIKIITNAFDVTSDLNWPKNVSIKFFHHIGNEIIEVKK